MTGSMVQDPENLDDLFVAPSQCLRQTNELLVKDEGIHSSRAPVNSFDVERGSVMRKQWHRSTSQGRISRGGVSLLVKAREWGKNHKILGYFSWLFLAIAIQLSFGLGGWAFPDGRPACFMNSNMSEETAVRVKNRSICQLSETLDRGVPILRFLSAFIVGGFVVSSVNIWLIRRSAYTVLTGATRNLLLNLCSLVPNQQDKYVFSRWAVLGYELAVLKGRGLMDSDVGKSYLLQLQIMHSSEWDVMVNGDRHTTVWFWIQVKAEKLMRENEISQHSFHTICKAITLSRDKANDLMSIINRSQPPPYVFVCGLLVNTNLAIYAMASGIKWAIWMYDANGGVWKEPRMYADALILFIYTTVYGMLFDICTILHNPFGPREIDVEHYKVGRGIRMLAKSFAKRTDPPTMIRRVSTSENEARVRFCDDNTEDLDNLLSKFVEQPTMKDMRRGSTAMRGSMKADIGIMSLPVESH